MAVNNSIRVTIALQESTAAAAARCRDEGMAIKNKKGLRSADQGTNADLTGVVTWKTWRRKKSNRALFIFIFSKSISATFYLLEFASPLSPETLTRTSQMTRSHICNSKLCNHSVLSSSDLNFTMSVWRRGGEKGGNKKRKHVWLLSLSLSKKKKNQCLSTAHRSSLTGKAIQMHLAAIVGSKKTNHNIIDVLPTTDGRTIDNLCSHPERKS